MKTDIKIASLVAVFIDFEENGNSFRSVEELYTSAMSLETAVYDFIIFMIYA